MSDKAKPNPIGGPKPIEASQGLTILERMLAIVGIPLAGLVTFAFLLTPTRLQGATRSARLRWQQRQNNLEQTADSNLAETNASQAAEKFVPGKPVK